MLGDHEMAHSVLLHHAAHEGTFDKSAPLSKNDAHAQENVPLMNQQNAAPVHCPLDPSCSASHLQSKGHVPAHAQRLRMLQLSLDQSDYDRSASPYIRHMHRSSIRRIQCQPPRAMIAGSKEHDLLR